MEAPGGYGAHGPRFSSRHLHHSLPLLQGPARQAGELPAPSRPVGGVSPKYTQPLRKHLLNGVQSYVFFADSNKCLIKTLLLACKAGESSGPTSSLRNSGCLLKAVPAPHSCRGGRLEGSGSLSSCRGRPFSSRESSLAKERPNARKPGL